MDDLVDRLIFELRDWNGKNRFAFPKVNALVIAEAADRIEALQAEVARYEAALIRLRDCDWVISLPDRMDAVRDIARQALKGTYNAE